MAVVASVLGLGKVPLTVWLSLFSLWAWVVAFLGGWLLRSPLGVFVPVWPGNLAVLVLAGAVGVVFARVTSRPLEPLYRRHGGRDRASLVGEVAEITTSRVDGRFGQARVEVGSDDLVVQVRCDRAEPARPGPPGAGRPVRRHPRRVRRRAARRRRRRLPGRGPGQGRPSADGRANHSLNGGTMSGLSWIGGLLGIVVIGRPGRDRGRGAVRGRPVLPEGRTGQGADHQQDERRAGRHVHRRGRLPDASTGPR